MQLKGKYPPHPVHVPNNTTLPPDPFSPRVPASPTPSVKPTVKLSLAPSPTPLVIIGTVSDEAGYWVRNAKVTLPVLSNKIWSVDDQGNVLISIDSKMRTIMSQDKIIDVRITKDGFELLEFTVSVDDPVFDRSMTRRTK